MAFSKNFVNELYKDTLDVSEAAAEEFISSVSNGQIEKIMFVIKRDGTKEKYNVKKIKKAVISAYQASNEEIPQNIWRRFNYYLKKFAVKTVSQNELKVEDIQDIVEYFLMKENHTVAKNYILYRERRKKIRDFVERKINWIENYKKSANTADATIDDNSNVSGKNIGIINAEIHKPDNIEISRGMIMGKLKELYPDFDAKNYVRDLMHHIIYKNDESSFAGSIAPYCVSVSMYEFMLHGLKNIGGQSAAPHNLDSYCGLFINFIFAVSGQFAGAVAVPEALLYFDYFARHSLGEKYYEKPDEFTLFGNELKELMKTSGKMIFNIDDINEIASSENGKYNNKAKNLAIKLAGSYKDGRLEDDSRTISSYISQKFQQIIYSINQPVAARGLQSAFVNFSYFDKPFYDNMFGKNTSFSFPDLSKPVWESFSWLQRYFCQWFNEERLKTVLTFPVESWALIYKNGKYADEDTARFVAAEFARGHSMFLYQSDTVDSLSSCCFSPDTKILWKSSVSGVHLTSFEDFCKLPYTDNKKNLKFFHNGYWINAKVIKTDNTNFYKVTTANKKVYYMTDNHINVTFDGEKPARELTTDDYLMFNTNPLEGIKEDDQNLTYAEGFVVGAFVGNGSFGSRYNDGIIYDTAFSENEKNYSKCMKMIEQASIDMGYPAKACLSTVYHHVYPVRASSRKLVQFIQKWTSWTEGTKANTKKLNLDCLLQSVEFRKGILAGWYDTDGGNSNRCYTTSESLKDSMEALITSLGMNSIIDCNDRSDEKGIIRGQEFTRNYPLWCVRWYSSNGKSSMKDVYKHKNNSIYFKVQSIEKVSLDVANSYCLECKDETNPYFTLPSGLITHNCRLKNKITTHEFNFTNGNMGVETGSKSVITLNLSRITQDYCKTDEAPSFKEDRESWYKGFCHYLNKILSRVYKYHTAYNERLWDMYDANLLTIYKAGFISLNKQYMTIGLNGLNQAAEFLGIRCNDNPVYSEFCRTVFSDIKNQNTKHNGTEFGHKLTFNTEQIPAESLAVKNYNWDKKDGYWVPDNINLYASYIFEPYDESTSVLEKLRMHGNDYIGDYLDGGAAAHINLKEHPTEEQYWKLMNYSAQVGCQYWTVNVPNRECKCGYIAKHQFTKCPKCGATDGFTDYSRIIGYLTPIKNWSKGRQIEEKKRIYASLSEEDAKEK